MAYMFSYSDFNNELTLDTYNVTNMNSMFRGSVYNRRLTLNTSNVEHMSRMFYNSKYNHPLYFDTSKVLRMEEMFYNAKFNQDISDWIIKNTDDNQDVIEYRNECIVRRREKGLIGNSIENNKGSSCRLKL